MFVNAGLDYWTDQPRMQVVEISLHNAGLRVTVAYQVFFQLRTGQQ